MSANNGLIPQASKEKLLADFEALIADTEELLGATANQGGERLAALRNKMTNRLEEAKTRITDAEQRVMERTRAAAKATDTYVQENPWQSAFIAGGVGFVLGFLLTRGSSSR
ncbi:MAG TPA: DUF883 family protein [Gammaproteobacteria bacterium]